MREGLLPVLLALAAGLMYLSGGPVWDDHTLIFGYLHTLDGAGLAELWTRPVGGGEVGEGYYRPLAMTLLALLSQGGAPLIHLAAALLHAGSVGLCWHLLAGRPGRTLGCLVFGLHPLASEVLGWASALPDALALHLGLWALLAARRWPLVALPLVVLAALSKETALLLLPLAWVGGLVGIGGLLVGAGSGLVVLLLRQLVGAGMHEGIGDKLDLVPPSMGWTLGSYLAPVPLTAVRDVLAAPAMALPLGLLVLVLLCLGLLAVGPPQRRLVLGGLLLMVAAPALALPTVLDGHLAAERYAYPGLLGLAWWMAAVSPRPAPRAVLAVVALLGLGAHYLRAPAWSSDEALFTAATEALPASSYAWHFRGYVELAQGQPGAAVNSLDQALATGHPHPEDLGLLIEALVRSGQPQAAVDRMRAETADELQAGEIAWWARAQVELGRPDQARMLLSVLRRADGSFDGPPWVAALAEHLGPLPTP